MKIVSIIPARGGSKGVRAKNIKTFMGKSLISHTIDHSFASELIQKTYVSTEDETIKLIADNCGANIIDRPKELAGDASKIQQVLEHAVGLIDADVFVFLQCTSPLRRDNDIDNAIKTMIDGGYDSVFSVFLNKDLLWKKEDGLILPINYDYKNRPNRQEIVLEYVENGAIYVFKKKSFNVEKNHICGKRGIYIMPREFSFEIDTLFDFWLCEEILRRHGKK